MLRAIDDKAFSFWYNKIMKAWCTRCKSEYDEESIPSTCPVCGCQDFLHEKSKDEKSRDVDRLKIRKRLLYIDKGSKKRRFLLSPLLLFDISIPILGYLLLLFYPETILFYIGVSISIVGVYRIVYYAVIANYCLSGIKKGITSVRELSSYMRLKTPKDGLIVIKRLIKYGIIYNLSVENGEDIIYHE